MWATCPANRIFPSILLSYQYYMCCINQQVSCFMWEQEFSLLLVLQESSGENLVSRWWKSCASVTKISCVGDENLVRQWWKSCASVTKISCVGDENLVCRWRKSCASVMKISCVGDENLVCRWRKSNLVRRWWKSCASVTKTCSASAEH